MAKIMVVDDEPNIVKIVSIILNREGHECIPAYSGEEALKKLETEKPDLITLDLMMPGIDGFETLKRIREKKETSSIPVVIISARVNESDIVKGLELGANDYFTKPYNKVILMAKVMSILKFKQMEDKLRESEERFRSVSESAIDGIILAADGGGKIILWNPAARNIFEYEGKEVLGKPLTLLMPKNKRKAHTEGMEHVLKTGKSPIIGKTIECVGLRKDGTEFPVEYSLSSFKTRKGDVVFSGFIRDITERKKMEENIKKYAEELEEKLRLLEEKGISRYAPLIKKKNSYLIKEKGYGRSLAVFYNLSKHGLMGLGLFTKHPDILQERYGFDRRGFKGECIWLSASGAGEDTINPSNLTAIHAKISEFTKNNENSVVLLLGLEYLITLNGFEKSLKFLNSLFDIIIMNNSGLIIALDPETLKPRELSLLENALIEIKDDDLIRLGLK